MKQSRVYRSREQLRQDILKCLAHKKGAMTRLEIAKELNISKSPRLIEVLEELVGDNLLVKMPGKTVKDKDCWLYWI